MCSVGAWGSPIEDTPPFSACKAFSEEGGVTHHEVVSGAHVQAAGVYPAAPVAGRPRGRPPQATQRRLRVPTSRQQCVAVDRPWAMGTAFWGLCRWQAMDYLAQARPPFCTVIGLACQQSPCLFFLSQKIITIPELPPSKGDRF